MWSPHRTPRGWRNGFETCWSASLPRSISPIGRPSIPPEKLLRTMLSQAFYSIGSERLLMERPDYDPLFRWFIGIRRRRRSLGPFGFLEEPRPAAS